MNNTGQPRSIQQCIVIITKYDIEENNNTCITQLYISVSVAWLQAAQNCTK